MLFDGQTAARTIHVVGCLLFTCEVPLLPSTIQAGAACFFFSAPLGEFQYMIYPRVAVVRTDTFSTRRREHQIHITLLSWCMDRVTPPGSPGTQCPPVLVLA